MSRRAPSRRPRVTPSGSDADRVSPLAAPPADLRGFPGYALPPDRVLYRLHRCERSPWWFSNDGSGRFDLEDNQGTCYLAAEPVGAFIEVFRTRTVIPEAEAAVRCLAELQPANATMLADCTAEAARAFGVTASLHSQPDYELTRAWAKALADAGFGGVRYRLAHDPSARQLGVALYGAAGEGTAPVRDTGPIPPDVLDEARRRFGLLVLPTPS